MAEPNADALGRRVREVWIMWAETQPDPKASWLVPYDGLPESDREADRRIGVALWGDGFSAGVDAGIQAAQRVMAERTDDDSACDPTKESRLSPVPHAYEVVGEEYGSLADGGSYEVLRCHCCGRVAYSPMGD
jgi:hypothetical protein